MDADKKYRIIISGGGTGGHVFPAIAIGNSLKKLYPETELLFVGAKGRLEMEKVPAAGYPIEGLWISGFQRRISWKNLVFPVKLLASLIKSGRILKRFRPDAAVGVGGYASGPLLYMAARRGLPVLIQEQNSYPGVTNRLLSDRANRVCVAYDGLERWFDHRKIIKTGNPVREGITALVLEKTEAVRQFGLDPSKPVLLVLGGSLGSRTINESIKAGLESLFREGLQIIWQCGRLYAEEYRGLISSYAGQVALRPFITEMDVAYSAADLIVARAGAITISELCLVGKPVILVPSPNVAEDHQTKNAMALVEQHAAWMIPDREARGTLANMVLKLAKDRDEQLQLSENIRKLAIPDAADRIAREVIRLIEKKRSETKNIEVA